MVNVNHVDGKQANNAQNTHLVDQHQLLVKIKVKVILGVKQNN
jgi:hypothetical protein